MTSTWTEIIRNKRGTWRLYYWSKHSYYYPYYVEFLG